MEKLDMLKGLIDSKLFSYFAILIIILLSIVMLAFLIKLIFRFLFSPIRFIFSLLGAFVLISAIGLLFAKNPIVYPSKNPSYTESLVGAMQSIEGVYSNKLPLVAWKIEEVTAYDGNTRIPATTYGSTPPLTIKVDYLPFGNIVLSYDPIGGSFEILEGLSSGKVPDANKKSVIDKILDPLSELLPKFIEQES